MFTRLYLQGGFFETLFDKVNVCLTMPVNIFLAFCRLRALRVWPRVVVRPHHKLLNVQMYRTQDYLTFEDALDALSNEDAFKKDTPGIALLICADPVRDNKHVVPNLGWVIDGDSLIMKYGIR